MADEIEFETSRPPVKDIIGGAGSYAALGARIVAGKAHSRSVGWIVDCGSDFPEAVRDTISSWDTHCIFRDDPKRLTTRGWNGYGPNERRDFKYLTPKLRLDHNSLTKALLLSKSFHMVCSSSRCCELVQGILERRSEALKESGLELSNERPTFVWEPVPDRCCEEELPKFYNAIRYVNVVSPNENELARFFGKTTWRKDDSHDRAIAENIVRNGIGPAGDGMLVIRAGKDGCYAFSQHGTLELPAFESVDVIDPTGAGNTFLGALAQGLATTGRAPFNLIQQMLHHSKAWQDIQTIWGDDGRAPAALICAIVAASFAIEQIGVPRLSYSSEGLECWNGISYAERILLYKKQFMDMYDTVLET
ncbi:conserved hypothetical protein [Uncinocarpus reesii 1704]|uniref:Carbohydrate kinase PfkB domain-containing protein n=1 Tax=Uncinocarpus reesii (strain UAMH 1704) TaxID=336963 RepID=C4JLC7_UNCRE|nr:uncharacterized protein UREG_03635 [Uncinocarpus reesii 1704]EEP78789.1 conserved hypothetical protein [Uncinocarpus reesii 1704]